MKIKLCSYCRHPIKDHKLGGDKDGDRHSCKHRRQHQKGGLYSKHGTTICGCDLVIINRVERGLSL